MKKVKFKGGTRYDLTKDKVAALLYDVVKYVIDTNSIILRNDIGVYDKYYLNNPIAKVCFEDATLQYRNEVIDEILS